MSDVPQEQYATVIREMIRHENDVTNHRIMWLLVGQGLLANAYVVAEGRGTSVGGMLAPVGILVALSAFVLLYKSYQARGYLHCLGYAAKRGQLPEAYLPLDGWPKADKRLTGWWRDVWVCPWIGRVGDALEPWLFLPSLMMFLWLYVLLRRWIRLDPGLVGGLAALLVAGMLVGWCIVWVWAQGRGGTERTGKQARTAGTEGDRQHGGE